MHILDGGIGRLLKQMGAPFQQPEWSALALMEDPASVTLAHQAFIDAGSEIITTNSYAVVPFHIGHERFLDRGEELLRLSGRLAQECVSASSRDIRVAAGIPPVCGSYKPDAFVEEDALTMLHIFKRALLPYVDIILAETQSSIAEMRAILQVFSRCSKPLWISLTLEDENFTEEPRLRSGEKLVDALSHVDRNAVQAILFNCSQPEVMAAAVELSRKELTSKIDIGVYANGFEPITNTIEANDGYSSIRQDLSPERYLEFAQQWKSLGANIVGGCCGIGTEHIAALAVLKD